MDIRFISAKRVSQLLGYTTPRAVHKGLREGTIVPPSHFGGQMRLWRESVIEDFIIGEVYKNSRGVWVYRTTGKVVPILAEFEAVA